MREALLGIYVESCGNGNVGRKLVLKNLEDSVLFLYSVETGMVAMTICRQGNTRESQNLFSHIVTTFSQSPHLSAL